MLQNNTYQTKGTGPVITFDDRTPGGRKLKVDVWKRRDNRTGDIYHVATAPHRSYKTDKGEWKCISDLSADDILTGMALSRQALDFVKKADLEAQSVG